jgi:hypothetical protein
MSDSTEVIAHNHEVLQQVRVIAQEKVSHGHGISLAMM